MKATYMTDLTDALLFNAAVDYKAKLTTAKVEGKMAKKRAGNTLDNDAGSPSKKARLRTKEVEEKWATEAAKEAVAAALANAASVKAAQDAAFESAKEAIENQAKAASVNELLSRIR